jgi:hypothetical protein
VTPGNPTGPTHGFDGTPFVKAALEMGPVFNGHDLLDQPEVSSKAATAFLLCSR